MDSFENVTSGEKCATTAYEGPRVPGALRVWWAPQLGMEHDPFYSPVPSVAVAKLILTTLANYDTYQFKHKIHPDYVEMGGLEQYDGASSQWVEWSSFDFESIDAAMQADEQQIA